MKYLLLMLLFCSGTAIAAADVKWLVCDDPGNGPKFTQSPDKTDLFITCTKAGDTFKMTIRGCVGPHVKKSKSTGAYTITCDKLLKYTEGTLIPGQ